MAWAKHGFSNTDILFGHAKARLDKVSVEDWLMLLMRIMIMEYNQLLFPGRFRLRWGMRECLTALRSVELTPPPSKGGEPRPASTPLTSPRPHAAHPSRPAVEPVRLHHALVRPPTHRAPAAVPPQATSTPSTTPSTSRRT